MTYHKILLFAVLLASCAPTVADQPDLTYAEPTQTPHIVIVTATPMSEPSETPTEQALFCPPDYYSQIAVGYIPYFGGTKKDAASADVNCYRVSIQVSTGLIAGVLSQDGLRVENCILHADKDYPCSLRLQNVSNFIGDYEKKNGTSELICLAVSNKEYNPACQG